MLARNCAMRPGQVAASLGVLALVSLAISAAFWAVGAWPVLPFALIEVVCLIAAFVVYARRAGDFDAVELFEDRVVVRQHRAGRQRHIELNRAWPGLVCRWDRIGCVELRTGATVVSVGNCVHPKRREMFYGELRRALNGVA